MLLACRLPGTPQSFGTLLTTSKPPAVPAEAPGRSAGLPPDVRVARQRDGGKRQCAAGFVLDASLGDGYHELPTADRAPRALVPVPPIPWPGTAGPPGDSGAWPMPISRCSSSAQVLLHSASGLWICSSTASCPSNAVSWACSASMLRRRQGTGSGNAPGTGAGAPGSSQALQPAGNGAQLSDERLSQAGNHAGCTLLIIGHQLSPLPARGTLVPATTRSFPTPRQVTPAPASPLSGQPGEGHARAAMGESSTPQSTDRRTGA